MKLETISDHLEVDNLLGCIKYQNEFKLYMQDIADWILNHSKYDPECTEDPKFRGGLFNISDGEVETYLKVIQEGEVSKSQIENFILNHPKNNLILFFYIDFDKRVFVNFFPYISVEDYLPSPEWEGIWGNPLDYLPCEIKSLFSLQFP